MQPTEVAIASPVPAEERIQAIDMLRGFALIGILTANMRGFNSPAPVYFDLRLMWTGAGDRIAQAIVDCLVSGKFITLFAFLFGLGFAVQLTRAQARGTGFTGFYSRRLLALAVFGAAHSFLLWWGDILLPYAVTGFLLLMFRNRTQKTVALWAQALYWLPVIFMLAMVIATLFGVKIPGPPKATPETLQKTVAIYSQGAWLEIFRERAREWASLNVGFLFFLPRILSLFLFGLWVWRRGIFQDLPAHLPLLRRVLRWGLALGLAGNLAVTAIQEIWHPNMMVPSLAGVGLWLASSIGVPALSAFYASAVILLFQKETWRRILMAFSFVGRMALTNYLLQTVLCTTLYYIHGFGLYGKIGPLVGLIPTAIIYAMQVPFSAWWLARYRYGPMEWLWRLVTYGAAPAMTRVRSSVAQA